MKLFKTIKKCYKYLYDQKFKFWLANLLKIVFLIVSLFPAYASSKVIASLETNTLNSILIMIVFLALSYVVYMILDAILFFIRQHVEKSSRSNLKNVFMRKLFAHDVITLDSAKITEILYTDVNNVINILFIIFDLVVNIIFIITLAIFLINIKWVLAVITILMTFISSVFTFLMMKKIRNKELGFRKETDNHFRLIRDIIKNIRNIKLSNSVENHLNEYENNLENVKKATVNREKTAWLVGYIITIIDYSLLIIIYLVGAKAVSNNLLTLANLLLFISYSKMFSTLSNSSLKSIVGIQQTMVSVERALPILDYHLSKKEKLFPNQLNQIILQDITFSYGEKKVLENFNLNINSGQCVLLVGDNGSGKTTILNLISGIVLADSGQLLFDNIPVNEIDYSELNKAITYYSQDDILFDQSIRKNILSFKDADMIQDDDLIRVCERLNILDVIMNMDKGFESILSEQKNLSLGQKKKILFVRSFLKPSQILLLDEPLTGLDQMSQDILLSMIKELKGKKTIIIATHRPELFECCDKCIHL